LQKTHVEDLIPAQITKQWSWPQDKCTMLYNTLQGLTEEKLKQPGQDA